MSSSPNYAFQLFPFSAQLCNSDKVMVWDAHKKVREENQGRNCVAEVVSVVEGMWRE